MNRRNRSRRRERVSRRHGESQTSYARRSRLQRRSPPRDIDRTNDRINEILSSLSSILSSKSIRSKHSSSKSIRSISSKSKKSPKSIRYIS